MFSGDSDEKEGAYDGDDVAMFILASVAFLFPLHDCGGEREGWVIEVKEEVGICMEVLEGKGYRTGFRNKGCAGRCPVFLYRELEAMAYSPRILAIRLRH